MVTDVGFVEDGTLVQAPRSMCFCACCCQCNCKEATNTSATAAIGPSAGPGAG